MKRAVMLEEAKRLLQTADIWDSPHAQTPEAAAVRRMLEERGYMGRPGA